MKLLRILLLSTFVFCQAEDVTLTIYKDGTALIKQPVGWSIPSGLSYITWNSLPDGIDKETPFLNISGADILSQRFNSNIFTGTDFFSDLKGKPIQVKPKNSKLIKGVLLEVSSGFITLKHSSGIITFNRNELEYLGSKYDEVELPTFEPFLSWDLKSKSARNIEGELVYKSKNFSWETVYRLIMKNEEKGELIAEAVISNTSDMDFRSSKIELVEGNLNKIRSKRNPQERAGRSFSSLQLDATKLMNSDELGDYHIYSLNGAHDLGAKENITVRMYGPLDVGYTK